MDEATKARSRRWATRSGSLLQILAWTLGTALLAINLLAFVAEAPPDPSQSGGLSHDEPARADGIRHDVPSWPAPGIATEAMQAYVQPVQIGEDLLALQEEMARAIASYTVGGKYAVAVTDLQTGETVSVNGETPHLSGCLANLFLLIEVLRHVDSGKLQLAEAHHLIVATSWSSNAATARDLYVLLGRGDAVEGVRAVDELIKKVLKLGGVVLDHPPGYSEHSLGVAYNNVVTAVATNRALAALWQGDLFSEDSRAYLLGRLRQVKPGLNYLTAALPEGVVSHKNGFFLGDTGYVDNDAGIVVLERHGAQYAYAVSFLSQEVPWKYGDVELGQRLVRLTYDVMASRLDQRLASNPNSEVSAPDGTAATSLAPRARR